MQNIYSGSDDYGSVDLDCQINCFNDLDDRLRSYKINSISIISMNIRSIRCHFPEFEVLIEQLKFKFDIIVLNEIWLDSSIDLTFELDGYKSFSLYRNSRGGGTKLFYRSNLSISLIKNLTFVENWAELLSVQINIDGINFNICSVYRPPDASIPIFNEKIDEIVSQFGANENTVLLGDFNIDLFNPHRKQCIEVFKRIMCSYNFLPVINIATRVATDQSSTQIDNIWSNFVDFSNPVSGVVDCEISDHRAVYYACKFSNRRSKSVNKYYRPLHDRDRIRNFVTTVSQVDFNSIVSIERPEIGLNTLINELKKRYDTCFPKKRIKTVVKGKPWITSEIKSLINKKHRLIKLYRENKISRHSLKIYCKLLTFVLKKSKESYYYVKLDRLRKKSGKMWRELNTIMGRNSETIEYSVIENGESFSGPNAASCFNKYFVSVGSNLAENFTRGIDNFSLNAPGVNESHQFDVITPDEISLLIHSFRNKVCNIDDIRPCILTKITEFISAPLAAIFNRCVMMGIYPDCLKCARVIPIFKSGDKKDCSNYRPISTLSIFNKIFEKLIHARLSQFFEHNNVLSHRQFGFRKKSNITLAAFTLISDILKSFNEKSYAVCCFVDLKKAFDTVNREVLLRKLYHYGIRNNVYDLVDSYLSNRMQYTVCNDHGSEKLLTDTGVPQGSVLGPLLFNLFINDISLLGTDNVLFADDGVFYCKGDNLDETTQNMQTFLYKLGDWLRMNKLTANESKTKLMLFTPRVKPSLLPPILFNGHPLQWVNEIRYLGIILDQNLKFDRHINDLLLTLNKVNGILYGLRKFLPTHCLKVIFFALAYSRLTQSMVIWGGAYENKIRHVKIVINKMLRNILKVCRSEVNGTPLVPTKVMYKQLNIMQYKDMYDFSLIRFMKHLYDNHFHVFHREFDPLFPRHNYSRRHNRLNYPIARVDVVKHATTFQCVRAINALPEDLLTLNNDQFKKKFKIHCLSLY